MTAPTATSSHSQPHDNLILADATKAYLSRIRRFRSRKTISAFEHMLGRFLKRLPEKRVSDISRKELLDHMLALKQQGMGDRTIHNHCVRSGQEGRSSTEYVCSLGVI